MMGVSTLFMVIVDLHGCNLIQPCANHCASDFELHSKCSFWRDYPPIWEWFALPVFQPFVHILHTDLVCVFFFIFYFFKWVLSQIRSSFKEILILSIATISVHVYWFVSVFIVFICFVCFHARVLLFAYTNQNHVFRLIHMHFTQTATVL